MTFKDFIKVSLDFCPFLQTGRGGKTSDLETACSPPSSQAQEKQRVIDVAVHEKSLSKAHAKLLSSLAKQVADPDAVARCDDPWPWPRPGPGD